MLCALLLGSTPMMTGCEGGGSGTTSYNSYADTENYSASLMEGEHVIINLATGLVEPYPQNIEAYPSAMETNTLSTEADEDEEGWDENEEGADYGYDETSEMGYYKIHTYPKNGEVSLNGSYLTYTPNSAFTGEDTVLLTYGNEEDLNFKYISVHLTIKEVNHPPKIEMGNILQKLSTNTTFAFGPSASDPDGDTLTFSVVGNPSWMTLDPATGVLSGTTPNYETNVEEIKLSVSDGILTSSLEPLSISIVNGNHVPTIEGIPTTYIEKNEQYSFTPIAQDLDGDALTFYIANKPSWAEFDSETGTLEGITPDEDSVYQDVSIYVYDGQSLAYLEPFTITVGVIEE